MSFNAKSGDPAFTLPGTIQLQNDGENEEQEFIMSSTVTDFARKLYNLLEDPSHSAIVCWGPERDCFTVKDTTLFAKNILPRVFNHSNFASFVRQLNKYDFHKIRKESSQDLDQTWTFKHPNFHGDRPEALQHIRRKAAQGAAGERSPQDTSKAEFSSLYSHPSQLSRQPFSSNLDEMRGIESTSMGLQVELDRLRDDNEDLRTRTRTLERNYDAMGTRFKNVEAAVALRQEQMDNLMQQFSRFPDGQPHISGGFDPPNLSTHQRQMVESTRHLPPLFTRAPLNLETVGGDPLSQQGKEAPTGQVVPSTVIPSSLNQSADPPVFIPISATPQSSHTGSDLGQKHRLDLPIQGIDQDREHSRRENLFDELELVDRIYPISEISEESPIRMSKRPRTTDTPDGWPPGASLSNPQGPSQG